MGAPALRELAAGMHGRAVELAREALARADADGLHANDGWLHAVAGGGAPAGGDRDAARGELQALEATGPGLRRGDRAIASYLRDWLAWLEGNTPLAHREARAACTFAAEVGVPALECFARIAWAQLLAEAGDMRDAQTHARAAATLAKRVGSPLVDFAVELATADIARQAGDEAAAVAALGRAFRIGREHAFVHLPWWRSAAAAELCVLALRHGIERRLCAHSRAHARPDAARGATARAAVALAAALSPARPHAGRARDRTGGILRQGPGPADGAPQGARCAGWSRRARRAARGCALAALPMPTTRTSPSRPRCTACAVFSMTIRRSHSATGV
jgi:hypothetical protein